MTAMGPEKKAGACPSCGAADVVAPMALCPSCLAHEEMAALEAEDEAMGALLEAVRQAGLESRLRGSRVFNDVLVSALRSLPPGTDWRGWASREGITAVRQQLGQPEGASKQTKIFAIEGTVKADPKRDLPEATVRFTIALVDGRPTVQAAFLFLKDRGDESVSRVLYDGGKVAVDFADGDQRRPVGITFLAPPSSPAPAAGTPELTKAIERSGDRLFGAGATLLALAWRQIEILVLVALDVARRTRAALDPRNAADDEEALVPILQQQVGSGLDRLLAGARA